MRKLILIKHARPQVVDHIPSHVWHLSDEGRAACGPLAEILRPHDPGVIITSDEPKAQETGQRLADALGKPIETADGLHEHDRSNVPMMPSREFLSLLALFFKQRDRLVLGRETADDAADRFKTAIETIVSKHTTGNIAVVTHGTVLALFAADHGAGDAFLLYRKMGLPSLMTFSLPDYRIVQTVERMPA
jgi:broad specificity phosphatase PhoE